MNEIASRQNTKFKLWATLGDARGIKKAGRTIISGKKLVEEFLRQAPAYAEALLLAPKTEPLPTPDGVALFSLAAPLFKQLDTMGTQAPLLVVRTPVLEPWKSEPPRGLELIVALSDPGNLGALLRSAEAFGVHRVILTEEACSPFLPKSIRAASGANFRLQIMQTGPLSQVRVENACCLDMAGEDLAKFPWPHDLYLILGEEGRGIPAALAAHPLSIGMTGKAESLNATVAASIALFHYRQHH